MGLAVQLRLDVWALDKLVGHERVPGEHVERLDERQLERERAVDELGGVYG